MPITAQLQQFIDDELSRAPGLAEETVSRTLAQLQQPREGMLSPSEREHYFELTQALPRQAADFVRAFGESLRHAVLSEMHGGEGAAGSGAPRGLELMDETRVEVDIEVSGAAQLIGSQADWELRELQTFTATLSGQKHVGTDLNPLRPPAYARALWDAAGTVTHSAPQRTILLRTAAGVLSGLMKKAWAAACTRLEAQGVEPGLYRTVVLPGPVVQRAPTVDVTQPGALEGLLPRMPDSADQAARTEAQRERSTEGPSPAFEQALARLESMLQRANSSPGASASSAPQLGEHRASLLAGATETVDRQIIELLSRLFEAVLSDARLPPAFRAVMARLQVSALRVALVDPCMLQVHDHPVWKLMNRIGSAAETYTHTTDARWVALLAYAEALVEDMSRAPTQDAQLYRHSLTRLEAFLGEQLREQQARAQPTADALARLEQRAEIEQQISQRLTEQMVTIRTSAGVRRFVTGTWAKVIAESMQRHGEKADTTLEYLRATDDLLWSLRLPDHPKSRQRLLALLPGLLHRLRIGMSLLGLPDAEQQPVFDELMAVHTEALRPGGKAATAEPELTPQEIVQRMREESVWEPPSRPPFSESLIDLSSMETVPAEVLPGARASGDGAARVDAMPLGSRHHLFLNGRWKRVQLLWRSPRGEYLLFAGPDPVRTHAITRRALERLTEEALVKPLDDVSLVQRAVDSLMQRLALPA
jgi:hypothetical protein